VEYTHCAISSFCSTYYVNKWRATTQIVLLCTENLPKWKRLLFTGGDDPGASADAEEESRENLFMAFFRDAFSTFLLKKQVQVIIVILYFAYLGVNSYGISQMEEGLKIENIFLDDSYMHAYRVTEDKYLRTAYPYRIQVIPFACMHAAKMYKHNNL